jgi:hypothetical protein
LEQQRQASQEAMDENVTVDGCIGAIVATHSSGPTLAVNFWRDAAALKANAARAESLLAAARQSYPTMQIGDPEILDVFASARP